MKPDDAPRVKKITSAGVLPFAVFKKRVFFLLGKEVFDPSYADSDKWGSFGGKLEGFESVEEGAAREFYEETAGCIMDLPYIRQKLREKQYMLSTTLHPQSSSSFRVYLMLVSYKDYPGMFRRTRNYIQYVGGSVKLVEKSHLKWFTYREVYDTVFFRWWGQDRYARKPKFRAKFSEMMRRLMQNSDFERQCIATYKPSKML